MTKDGGQRIASSNGAMLADPASLGNLPGIATPAVDALGVAMPDVIMPDVATTDAVARDIATPDVVMPDAVTTGAIARSVAAPHVATPGMATLDIAAQDVDMPGTAVARIFDPQFWADRGELVDATRGRGSAWFIGSAAHQWVLRHCRRGGFIARFSSDHYVWAGEKRVRAFAEWRLLANLTQRGLPVPKPIAARYQRRGIFYRCDLITRRIAGAQPLSSKLEFAPLADGLWREVGETVARFHAAGVDHADLNAHNILLDDQGAVSVIDFDRGKLRRPGAWTSRNLRRLHRSLVKISRDLPPDRFSTAEWGFFLAGYGSASGSPAFVK